MRVAWALVRLGALRQFAWGLDVLVVLASGALVLVLNTSLWGAAVEAAGEVGGLGPAALGTYVVFAWAANRVTHSRIAEDLGQRAQSGQIATDLLKPLPLPAYLFGRHVGGALARLALLAVPLVGLGATWVPLQWPAHGVTWIWAAISLALGVVVAGELGLLVGLVAVQLRRGEGLARLQELGMALLSGALLPLAALPDAARWTALVLPFQATAYAPAAILTEAVPPAGRWALLGAQAGWALVLAAGVAAAWSAVARRLTVAGG